MHHGRIRHLRIETSGIDTGLFPEVVKVTVLPLLVDVRLVIGDWADGSVPALPGHACEPGLQIDRFQRRQQARVGLDFGTLETEVVGPDDLFELEGTSLADASLVRVGEAAAVDIHGLEARWIQACESNLGVSGVGEAHGCDEPVTPRLLSDPAAGIEAVGAFIQILREFAFGVVPAPAILEDHYITVAHVELGNLGPCLRGMVCRGEVPEAGYVAAVRGAFHDDRKSARNRSAAS